MSDIEYSKLEIQSYLKYDSKLSNEDKYLLFKFRTRMVSVKMNYKNSYTEYKCQLGCNETENLKHILECEILLHRSKKLANNAKIGYEDIFSEIAKQADAILLLAHAWSLREKLIDSNQLNC